MTLPIAETELNEFHEELESMAGYVKKVKGSNEKILEALIQEIDTELLNHGKYKSPVIQEDKTIKADADSEF